MRRRDVVVGLGAATVWPFLSRAQTSARPVIGFLGSEIEERGSARFVAFHKALAEFGYTAGENVAIEYRWAQGQVDRYPALAAELVRRSVSVIASMGGVPSARAAKAATTTIPIVTQGAFDPVETGIVTSLSRPGANITGVTNLGASLGPKQLELIHQLMPEAKILGLLLNPSYPLAGSQSAEMQGAARGLGLEVRVVHAAAVQDFEKAFASLAPLGVKAVVIGAGQPFTTRSGELARLATRYKMPAIAEAHEFVASGGLMTYGGKREDAYALAGQYVARILKGEEPANLPIVLSTKVELMLNIKAAKALGLNVPLSLLGRADEVIE
jgi:putative tryptophan/tyrosine transport system substrate-binding protein